MGEKKYAIDVIEWAFQDKKTKKLLGAMNGPIATRITKARAQMACDDHERPVKVRVTVEVLDGK